MSQEISEPNTVGNSHEITRRCTTIQMSTLPENLQIRQVFTTASQGGRD